METPQTVTAIARIEWGGMYDTRELELIEWQGEFSWEDLTGGFMTIHEHLNPCKSRELADAGLLKFVMDLGEPATYVEFSDRGIIRSTKTEKGRN